VIRCLVSGAPGEVSGDDEDTLEASGAAMPMPSKHLSADAREPRMSVFFLWLPTVALATLAFGARRASVASHARAASHARLKKALSVEGLTFVGDLDAPERGLTLRRGDGASVESPAAFSIGASNLLNAPSYHRCTIVRLPVSSPDLVVAEQALAPSIFGPFPPPRTLTGDAAFDDSFGVFPAPTREAGVDYRGVSADAVATPWASPDILEACRALGLRGWIVRDGQGTFAFSVLPVEGQVGALRIADAVASASVGAPSRPLAQIQLGVPDLAAHSRAFFLAVACIIGATLVTSAVSSALTFQDATQESPLALGGNTVACPGGGIYSAGPGFRKQHRVHLCHRPGELPTPAQDALLMVWTWGSMIAFSIGSLLALYGGSERRKAQLAAHAADQLSPRAP
jgi:hypothetical protein